MTFPSEPDFVQPDLRNGTTLPGPPSHKPIVEPANFEHPEHLQWEPVVRLFVGGPLDGRALEGADSREWEIPGCGSAEYWHEWFLYTPSPRDTITDDGWIVYVLHPFETLNRANQRYINGDIDLDEFEQAVDWALAAETRELHAS